MTGATDGVDRDVEVVVKSLPCDEKKGNVHPLLAL